MLAAAVTKSGRVADVQRLIDEAVDPSMPVWRRTALLQGLDAALPVVGGRGGRGGGGLPGVSTPGGRVVTLPGRGVTLPAAPAALAVVASGGTAVSRVAASVLAKVDWPGRPAPVVPPAPLTAEQQKRASAGAELYKNTCVGCHDDTGRGRERLGGNLVDSTFVNATDATAVIRILLGGKEGAIGLMPPLGASLGDEQIASVLTYIRRAWGHTGSAVNPLDVSEVRGLTRGRTRPWSDAELQPPAGGGRAGRGGRGQ